MSPSCAASACLHLRLLSLFRLPASFSDTVCFSCSLLLVYGFFFLFGYLLLSYHSLSFARFSTCFLTRGFLCLLNCPRSALGSLFLLPRFLIPLGSHSVYLSFAPPSFRLAVSCFFHYFSRGYLLHVVSGPAFPRYYRLSLHGLFSPSLAVLGWSARLPFHHFPIVSVVHLPLYVTPVRRFTFLLSRYSDSVESPVPYATGSSLWAGPFHLRFFLSSRSFLVASPSHVLRASLRRSPADPPLLLIPLVLFHVTLLFFSQVLIIFRGSLV